jgi:predicted alpha-1,2-mannosidase
MIGTGNGGEAVGDINDFPGVDTPFGMMQLSPDTPSSGVGYSYGDTSIRGFSLDHASAGCSIFGDVPILPTTGPIGANPGNASATFSHDHEEATLGSYDVQLTDSGVHADLTATSRTGLLSFGYPAGSTAQVLVKSGASLAGNSAASVTVNGNNEVSGSATTNGLCGLGSYTVYFDIRFSQPFTAHGTWQGATVTPGSASATGRGSGAYLTFDTTNSTMVRAKVAMSYVSVDGARNNMAQELPGWNPTSVAAKTRAEWRQALNTVQVGGGSDADLTTFYTALYHSLQFPSIYNDVDGRYMGFDNQIHRVPAGQTQYSTFSDWDTYRALAPLQAMLFPKQAGDMANSLIRAANEQGGWMPKWPMANVSTTGTMNGDNAVPLIANTVAFGGRNVNVADGLPIMLKGANHSQVLGWVGRNASAWRSTSNSATHPTTPVRRARTAGRASPRRWSGRSTTSPSRKWPPRSATRRPRPSTSSAARTGRTPSTPRPATSSRAMRTVRSPTVPRSCSPAASARTAMTRATPPTTGGRCRRTWPG